MNSIDSGNFETLLLRNVPLVGCNRTELDTLTLTFADRPSTSSRTQVALKRLSFGASHHYHAEGGAPIIRDDSPATAPFDRTRAGIIFTDVTPHSTVPAAYTRSASAGAHLRLSLHRTSGEARSCILRAHCNGIERVAPQHVSFNVAGEAELELNALFPRHRIGTIDEDWTWEFRVIEALNDSLPEYESLGTVPVRLYITASAPVNAQPRESFYHLACSAPADRCTIEQAIWRRITGFQYGHSATNARHEPLTFWREFSPGRSTDAYIRRDAQALITATDSSCLGWADLFAEALAIHGIHSTVAGVKVDQASIAQRFRVPSFDIPDGRGNLQTVSEVGLLVKPFHWQFANADGTPPDDGWNLDAGDFAHSIHHPAPHCSPAWRAEEAAPLGTPCPSESGTLPGFFANHAIVIVADENGSRIYDPAFAFGPHDSLESYEDELLGRGQPDSGGLFAVVGWQLDPTANPPRVRNTILGAMPVPPGPILAIHGVNR